MNDTFNWLDYVMNGGIVCSIGQLAPKDQRKLDHAATKGTIYKTRAPFAGNFGAMKTYYAASEDAFDRYQTKSIAKFNLAALIDKVAREDRKPAA